MRNQSRPNIAGQNWAIDYEDGLFWPDWVVAGGLALFNACVSASQSGTVVPVGVLWAAVLALVLGLLVLPFALRGFAYEATTGRLKKIKPFGIGWVLIADFLGMIPLFASVLVGVKVYG